MIFLLVILTFVVGISVSAYQESREKRAQEPRPALELTPNPVLVRVPSGVAQPCKTDTGNLWLG